MRKLSMDELNRKSVEEFKESDKTALIAVLENIRSAYNVGSVFRTADAFLMEAIYITGYTCTPPHKEIKKPPWVQRTVLTGNILPMQPKPLKH
jgi:tRNA G18 (ribose-2'-O)-methylase SpoU